MKVGTRKYRIIGIEPILGSQPANPDVRTAYIASLAPESRLEEELELTEEQKQLRAAEEADERMLTVFLRNPKTGALTLYDYTFRGFFKSALDSLKSENGILQSKSKVDKYLFVSPRMVDLTWGGKPITDYDSILERSLRAMTMQGPRNSLAASECVNHWECEIEVTLIPNDGTAKSKPLTWDAVETALDYGRFCGQGQFRNGSYGRFTWERVEA